MEKNADFIKEVERLVEAGQVHEIEGKHFATKMLMPIIFEPEIANLTINTLTGFIDYCKANVDQIVLKDCLIIVDDHETVRFVSKLKGEWRKRDIFILAKRNLNIENFIFDKFIAHEFFVIKIMSKFVQTKELQNLIKFVSRIEISSSFKTQDDGVTQEATVKKGVSGALFEVVDAPSTIKLKPFRTFNEIEQPESQFLFRMRQVGPSEHPRIECALLESDGGVWRNEAQQNIKEYLKKHLPQIPILA